MEKNQKIVLYMNDGCPCGEYTNIIEAYKALQEIKETDKAEHIKGNEYYFELEEENENEVLTQEVKIYRRKNRYFMRFKPFGFR